MKLIIPRLQTSIRHLINRQAALLRRNPPALNQSRQRIADPVLAVPIQIEPPVADRGPGNGLGYGVFADISGDLGDGDDLGETAHDGGVGVDVVDVAEEAWAADDVHDAARGGEVEVEGGVAVFGVVEGVASVDEDEQFLGHFIVLRRLLSKSSESENLEGDRPFLDDVVAILG